MTNFSPFREQKINYQKMDNKTIAENFSLLARLMEIHGENSFKIRSYANAAFVIEKLPVAISTLSDEKIFSIKGIGEAIGKKIRWQLENGSLPLLEKYLEQTPAGIIDMLRIKGLGPKKIAIIWKELEIETMGELLYACTENRLLLYKGFGAKTQENIQKAIEFFQKNIGSYLFADLETDTQLFHQKLVAAFPQAAFRLAGLFRRNMPVIDKLEWVTTATANEIIPFLETAQYQLIEKGENSSQFQSPENVRLIFYHTSDETLMKDWFRHSCSDEFLKAWEKKFPLQGVYDNEQMIFDKANLPFIPPFLRESHIILAEAEKRKLPKVIQETDIRAVIHSHSNWSDGIHTIEEMALAARDMGYDYIVLSDHSQSAFYANGLNEQRVKEQHKLIDQLNEKLAPFKIFKSIESDILYDGRLDYPPGILERFDLVIASIHANLKMPEEKAMARLMAAIENPYTTILGHMTGRLLLSREGYPVNHRLIIEACARHEVVIELNAHPKRLDIDWHWLPSCIEKNVLISIDPDAHSIAGFQAIRYGVLAAQKGGLTATQNLSSFSLPAFEAFLKKQQAKRKR